MIRRLPIMPTILVLAAAGVMVALGVWQLGRAEEKAQMIAEFEAQAELGETFRIRSGVDGEIYSSVEMPCPEPANWQAVAGRNSLGQSGYVHRYECQYTPVGISIHEGRFVTTFADVGWSRSPEEPSFSGAIIIGTLVALGDDYKVVASEPLAGLQPLAKPDPKDLPNNHLAYAGQWFFFALTALVIYWFAVRARLAKRD